MSNQKPKTWKQTSHEWDSNRVYGLTLPKIVVSNRLTREQGIAGMDIMDVPLHTVNSRKLEHGLRVISAGCPILYSRGMRISTFQLSGFYCEVISGGNNNWALRHVAHGRTVQWENFRSRQEAIFCGVLMRGLRSEQEGSDFVTILNACQKQYFPSADLHDWPARYNAIKRLAEDMVKEFRKKAPVQANQTLLTRLQALESENARIIAVSPTPNHPRRAGTPKTRSAPPRTMEDPHDEENGAETAPFGSPLPLDEHPFDSPDAENIQDPVRRTRMNSTSPNQTVFVSLRAATLSPPL